MQAKHFSKYKQLGTLSDCTVIPDTMPHPVVKFETADLKITVLVYLIEINSSGCTSQVISWSPAYEYLDRSILGL